MFKGHLSTHKRYLCGEGAIVARAVTFQGSAAFGKHRILSETQSRMEEEARKLLEEGIKKKLVSPGQGELSTFPNGTKVKVKCQ